MDIDSKSLDRVSKGLGKSPAPERLQIGAEFFATATPTPLGALGLVASEKALILAQFLNGSSTEHALKSLSSRIGGKLSFSKNGILVEAAQQLQLYFNGEIRRFSLPLKPVGTPFQKRVWEELLRISYGSTCSYGEIARRIRKPHAARAIGQACNANPLAILVPCHRVVGADGDPKGYSGGLENKLKLLDHERRILARDPRRADTSSLGSSQSKPLPYRPASYPSS